MVNLSEDLLLSSSAENAKIAKRDGAPYNCLKGLMAPAVYNSLFSELFY